MGLNAKAIVILIGTLSTLGLLSIIFFLQVIRPSFIEIEKKEAIKDLQRVVNTLQNEADHLSDLNHDWAAWDVTYEFMQTISDEYIEENLPVSSFKDNYLNIIHFYDVNGKLIWGESRDLESEELIDIKDFSGDSLPEKHLLLKFAFDKSPLSEVGIEGLWITEHGPMLISSRPILNNENEGPVRGVLVMGRFLDNDKVEHLNQQINVKFNVVSIKKSDSWPQSLQNTVQNLSPENPYYIDNTRADHLKLLTFIPDLSGGPGLLIWADKDREIFEKSQTVMNYTIVSILLSIVTGFVLLSILLQKIVIGPINSLTQHVLEIGSSGNLSSQLKKQSNDEVGLLTEEFNSMISKLNDAKGKLQEQSFQLGMAELASGIMHNLRNTLHMLFSNIDKIRKTIEQIPVEKITMARHELATITESEERRADLIEFLDATNTSLLDFISKTKIQLNAIGPLAAETEHVIKSFEEWAYKENVDKEVLVESALFVNHISF